jgi:hypothetical protein
LKTRTDRSPGALIATREPLHEEAALVAPAERPPEGLLDRSSRALKWNYLGNSVRAASQLAIGIVLARLLGPEAFGTVAIVIAALAALVVTRVLGRRLFGGPDCGFLRTPGRIPAPVIRWLRV